MTTSTSATTREFSLEFLKEITDDFSEKHIIGRGGYGVVYKAVLETGEDIALKKLYPVPGLDDTQFRNEFNHLMRAQHPNITRLVGYCYFQGHDKVKHNGEYVFAHWVERVLCFEYLHGGSLDGHISDESCGLDWHTRFKIIKGVGDGLNYLHNGSKVPIYHLDLKPANILLDKNMVPKIGDFGLSKLLTSAQTYTASRIIGTLGYMPPEYIEGRKITPKFDVFSLGIIIIRIIAGEEGYSIYREMSSQKFLHHVNENWRKRLQETMSPHTSNQISTCIGIALRCVEANQEKRPTIADIVYELNRVDTAQNSPSEEVANFRSKHALNQTPNSERRGRILFSAINKPLVPFDIFSCPSSPSSTDDELHLTDGVSNNYNGHPIPPAALKTLLKSPKLTDEAGATDADVDAGHVSGLVFVSERDDGLETLYIILNFNLDGKVKVFALADIFGTADFSGGRLENSGCIGGGYNVESRTIDHFLIYVSTKEPVQERRGPRTVVYKTNLTSGKTEGITPKGVFDLSPAVSPSGKLIAVAAFESKSWNGETENLNTDIYVMNVDGEEDQDLGRKLLIKDGGWPSWASDNIIFFHRGTNKTTSSGKVKTSWGVFRYNISTRVTVQVTPKILDAVTPAAISETKVAVATMRQRKDLKDIMFRNRPASASYRQSLGNRHIEIFDMNEQGVKTLKITQTLRPTCDHYNPFVLDGGARIGYHRCRSDLLQHEDNVPLNLHKLDSPVKDVSLLRVSGVFPTISNDGSKLAFIDSKLKKVWVADSHGLRAVYKAKDPDSVYTPVWNQNPDKDILYVCIGTSFNAHEPLEIYAIHNASGEEVRRNVQRLTYGGFNNGFPSSSPDGNKIVFRSTRDFFPEKGNPQATSSSVWKSILSKVISPMMDESIKHKNLCILNADVQDGQVTRLTKGKWTDTNCQWSPKGDWVVFSSTRKPEGAKELDNGLNPAEYFSLFLVKATDPGMGVVIRVMDTGSEIGGYMHHHVFSPDGTSIAVTADHAAVSVDPVSMPTFKHGVRHYGDIFEVDIDPDVKTRKNKGAIKGFRRMTHSKYGCGPLAWTTTLRTTDPDEHAQWNMLLRVEHPHTPVCPYSLQDMRDR